MNARKFIVHKTSLKGKIKISGAKNSALHLLTASILTDGEIELFNVPNKILDIQVHIEMLNLLGKKCELNGDNIKIKENSDLIDCNLIWEKPSIRNTLLILGALTARFGSASVPLPGGCKIGERKYDLHIQVLEKMGAKVWEENGYLFTKASRGLIGAEVFLSIRSTGATENAIICGTLSKGKTIIWNPHIRPEVLDLVNMLNKMGAKISIHGQKCIEIDGVSKLHGTEHTVIPDNVEAITWAIASVLTNGDVEIEDFPFEHLEVPLVFLRESGMKYFKGNNSIIVRGGIPYPVEISTGPYPGINSDMQPLFAVYGAASKGESKIVDLRFPGRYSYAEELSRMGMAYDIEGDLLKIHGGNRFLGTRVKATDLRSGIALILAGLIAEGETIIENAWQIERGYENLQNKLNELGCTSFSIIENQ